MTAPWRGPDRLAMRPLIAALTLLLAWSAPGLVRAQETDALENVQQELDAGRKAAEALEKKAASLEKEVADLQAALIKAAASVQKREREVSEIESTLATLSERETEQAAALKRGRADLSTTLVALQRLSTMPRQALLFSTESPADMARSARLLSLVTPVLDARARALQSELNDIKSLRQEMAYRRDDLTAALSELAGENQRLSALVARKAKQRKSTLAETEATKQRLARLADQAKNLQDLIERLEQTETEAPPVEEAQGSGTQAPAETATEAEDSETEIAALAPAPPARHLKPADLRPFPKNLAKLTRPASGPVIQKFGAKTDTAGTMKGVELETRPGAQIVATFDGQIVFEGPFRGYGQILIIEHGGGYHTVLAGLDTVVVEVGQWLKAGEPIGRMGASGITEDGTQSGRPRLYVELRHDGEPVDPAPMLAAQNN
ncbi:murein hydrolase activator EnvC [Dongia sp.]|uniref:murein hydrolase activator EnvC family protein n=1 Tax=Dongia sp. TaxID=1977262 RepID=UPI0035B4879F